MESYGKDGKCLNMIYENNKARNTLNECLFCVARPANN